MKRREVPVFLISSFTRKASQRAFLVKETYKTASPVVSLLTSNEAAVIQQASDLILVIVMFHNSGLNRLHYVCQSFRSELDFGATSANCNFLTCWKYGATEITICDAEEVCSCRQ
jgi:hypothetical protein